MWLMFLLNLKSWRQILVEGGHHVKMKTRIGVMLLEAKECQRLTANHQKHGEKDGTGALPQPSEGANPAGTLILYF